jgi:uncharacterized protein with von Willebrand factor type A (vWA) domain
VFTGFFHKLREARIPVTIREYLMLLEAMQAGVAQGSVDEFYWLARAALVKDEKHFDRFDRVFGEFFSGLMAESQAIFGATIPDDWLRRLAEHHFSEEEMAKLEKMGFQQMLDELAKRLAEQDERHAGGNRWVGTDGTSPFGNSGRNPSGVRIGGEGGGGSATKVWQRREFRNLDGSVEIGTRNIKVALRRLRKFIREGAEDEFDLDDTIASTARNAGLLDIRMRPERKNRVKVLLFIDVGGTMDAHVKTSEELFSAARTEFKHLEHYYFHNFLYERVWRETRRGYNEWIPTTDVFNTYGPDYKVIVVGDATMSPYEITEPGGSIEHWNEEAGAVWLQRLARCYPDIVWLNPVPQDRWGRTVSISLTQRLLPGRMFPLSLDGLDAAMDLLRRRASAAPPQIPVN